MDSIKELMFSVAGAFIFCAAVTLFLTFTYKVDDMSAGVQQAGSPDTSLASVSGAGDGFLDDRFADTVTYSEVVAQLSVDRLQYDVQIDGKLFSMADYNLSRFDLSGIRRTETYTVSRIYDENNVLLKLVFRSN